MKHSALFKIIALTLLVVIINGCGGGSGGSKSSTGDRAIVFSSDRDNNPYKGQIWVMNSDGTSPQRLTNNSFDDFSPAWSPDQRRIAYVQSESAIYTVYVMDADGGNCSQLIAPSDYYISTLSWSPDGQKIAYYNGGDIWVVNVGGGTPVNIIGDAAKTDRYPSWSPDSTEIAFSSSDGGIYVVKADGSESGHPYDRKLLDNAKMPAWSPDGQKLAYSSSNGGAPLIYIVNSDGSGTPRPLTGQTANREEYPHWTRDSKRIFYLVNYFDIFIMNADGSGAPVNLTEDFSVNLDGDPSNNSFDQLD